MALIIRTTPGDTGFDMRTLNFDALTTGMTITGFNPFIVQWTPATGPNSVSLFGDAMVPQVVGGVLQGLTGTQITQIFVTADTFALNFAGMTYAVSDFMDLVQAKDWTGLAQYLRQGNDSIVGTANNDTLLGGDGNDIFNPGAGQDLQNGGRGDDTLRASDGHDVMVGGAGADVFLFEAEPVVDTSDSIRDFRHGVDQIHISDVGFNDVGNGGFDGAPLDEVHFALGRQATTDAHSIVYNQNKGFLYYDPDGVGGADQILMARLGAGTVLTFADFMVI